MNTAVSSATSAHGFIEERWFINIKESVMNRQKHHSLCNITCSFTDDNVSRSIDLDELNSQTLNETLPVIIYIGTLMLVGMFGNTLTIYVYQCTFQKQSSTIFIISIAVYDLMGCVIAMPLEIYDLVFQYTFYSAAGCKAIHFVRNILVFGSSVLLVEIAFERYTKICRPWYTLECKTIKLMCIFTGVFSVLLSFPALVIFGITRIETPVNGTYGYDCEFDDNMKGGIIQQLYFYILGLVFIVILSALSGFYLKIWYEIRKRYRIVKCRPSVRFVRTTGSGDDTTNQTVTIQDSSGPLARSIQNRKRASRRTTLIFSAVSGVFILTYLPAICILIWRSFKANEDSHFKMAEELIYRLHMFNNVINPVFYGFLNPQFRNNCLSLISRSKQDTDSSDENIREMKSFTLQTRLSQRWRTSSTHL